MKFYILFLVSMFLSFSVEVNAKGGTLTITTDKSRDLVAGEWVTYTVSYDAVDATAINAMGVTLDWDANVLALDAATSMGVVGDNDGYAVNYLDGASAALINNENSRVTVSTMSDSDLFIMALSDEDVSGDPLFGVSGRAYVNNTRTVIYPEYNYTQAGAVISDYELFSVALLVKANVSAGGSNIKASIIAISDDSGSVVDDFAVQTMNVTVADAFTMTHSYVSGLNLVPFTLTGTGVTTTADLDAMIVAANSGVTVSQIFGWDAANQRYGTPYAKVGGFVIGEFDLVPGEAYFIDVSGTASLVLSGLDHTASNMRAGLNLVAVPMALESSVVDTTTLDAYLAAKAGGATVSQVFAWDAANQRYGTPYAKVGGFVVGDFSLQIQQQGYFVDLSADAVIAH